MAIRKFGGGGRGAAAPLASYAYGYNKALRTMTIALLYQVYCLHQDKKK